jgi:hypothetical protein
MQDSSFWLFCHQCPLCFPFICRYIKDWNNREDNHFMQWVNLFQNLSARINKIKGAFDFRWCFFRSTKWFLVFQRCWTARLYLSAFTCPLPLRCAFSLAIDSLADDSLSIVVLPCVSEIIQPQGWSYSPQAASRRYKVSYYARIRHMIISLTHQLQAIRLHYMQQGILPVFGTENSQKCPVNSITSSQIFLV